MNEITKFDSIVEQQGSLLAEVNLIAIVDKETMTVAQDLLAQIAELKKGITAFCDNNVKAAKAAHDAATSMRRSLLAPTEAAEKIIRDKLREFAAAEERKRIEQERAIKEEQEKQRELAGVENDEAPAPTPKVRVETAIDAGGFRTDWKFRIIDASLVPREYLIVDEKAIGALVRTQKDRCNIPGIEVYSEKIPVSRR